MNSHFSYKPTTQNWIGEIPTHWSIKRLKYLVQVRKELSSHGTEELLSVTETRGIVKRKELRNVEENVSRSENLSGYRLVRKGDLVNNIMLVWKRGLGVSQYEGIVSPAYSVFSFNSDCDPNFFNYLLRSDEYISEFRRHSTGIVMSRLRLYDDSFGNVFAHLPPIEEQNLISCYLDKKTSQIDLLVEKVQKKIDLLNEQRTSLINHYVTKGLDTNVEMKDSGVEWIGEIPKHWNFTRNKNFLKLSKNIVGEDWAKFTLLSLGRSGITVRDLESGKGKFPESFETYQTVKRGQFVFCLFDIDETPRTVGLSNEDGMITGAYTVFDCSNNVSAEFIYYYYLTIDEFKGLAPHYSGLRKTIRPTKFLKLGMFLPSLQEQIEIVEQINRITQDIDKFIDLEANRKLVLNEYKQSLISSVVTGKVKVSEDMI